MRANKSGWIVLVGMLVGGLATAAPPAEPVLLKDINPGPDSSAPGFFGLARATMGGHFYFNAFTNGSLQELWMTDGTTEGTVMVREINPNGHAFPELFAVVDNLLYFKADDGSHGDEVWRTDGTAAGTFMVLNINTSGDSTPFWLTNLNGTLFFSAFHTFFNSELWRAVPAGAPR